VVVVDEKHCGFRRLLWLNVERNAREQIGRVLFHQARRLVDAEGPEQRRTVEDADWPPDRALHLVRRRVCLGDLLRRAGSEHVHAPEERRLESREPETPWQLHALERRRDLLHCRKHLVLWVKARSPWWKAGRRRHP